MQLKQTSRPIQSASASYAHFAQKGPQELLSMIGDSAFTMWYPSDAYITRGHCITRGALIRIPSKNSWCSMASKERRQQNLYCCCKFLKHGLFLDLSEERYRSLVSSIATHHLNKTLGASSNLCSTINPTRDTAHSKALGKIACEVAAVTPK